VKIYIKIIILIIIIVRGIISIVVIVMLFVADVELFYADIPFPLKSVSQLLESYEEQLSKHPSIKLVILGMANLFGHATLLSLVNMLLFRL